MSTVNTRPADSIKETVRVARLVREDDRRVETIHELFSQQPVPAPAATVWIQPHSTAQVTHGGFPTAQAQCITESQLGGDEVSREESSRGITGIAPAARHHPITDEYQPLH